MEPLVINLENHRTLGSKVFTGRDRGINVRNESKIDSLESEYDKVQVIVPSDVRSINPSFLEEFLFNVVQKLGADGFRKKFSFISEGRYDITQDLEEAVDRILREENALI